MEKGDCGGIFLVIPGMSGSLKWEGRGPGWPGQKVRHYLQNNHSKKSYRQAEEHLPSKHEALSSNPIHKNPKKPSQIVVRGMVTEGDTKGERKYRQVSKFGIEKVRYGLVSIKELRAEAGLVVWFFPS
jgi:hypothetical protein